MKKRGFTLLELLSVIVILGILGLIIVPTVDRSIKDFRAEAYEDQLNNIILAARSWGADHPLELPLNDGDIITITLGSLKNGGYVDVDIKNPTTNQLFPDDMLIEIERKGNNYEYRIVEGSGGSGGDDVIGVPTLILKGSATLYVEVGGTYQEPGYTAQTYNGNAIPNDRVTVTIRLNGTEVSNVDTTQISTYEIEYSVTDQGYTTTITREVIVRDTTAPIITVDGHTSNYTISHGPRSSFTIPNGTATDNSREDIAVTKSGNVTPTVVGTYPITYTAKDSSGNTATLVLTVTIVSPTYSDWLTESELVSAGHSTTEFGIDKKTQYRLTYTTTTRTTKTGSLWSTTYQPTGIVWQLALDTGTQTAIYPRTIRWRVKTVSQDSEDGKRVDATNTLKVQGTDGTVKSFPQTYNFVQNAGFDLTWTATLDGTFEANRIYLESFWWKYNKKSMASVVVTSWDEVTTTTGVTDWQDSNTTSEGTVTETETRTVYRYQTN